MSARKYCCSSISAVFFVLATTGSSPAAASGRAPLQAPAAQATSQASAPARPKRVPVKLEGFDIASNSGKAPNQIGGASRGLGGVTLYAPKMAKAFNLTPSFYWSTDDPTLEYTVTISSPAAAAPLYSAKVKGGHFTYPADAPALTPGATYVWSVQPSLDLLGGPVSASFVVVGGAERALLEAKLEAAKDPMEKPSPAEAKIMTEARVWYDAFDADNVLIERHPKPEYYRQRAILFDQLPDTSVQADADMAKASQ